jgi:hypothetical protein
MDGKSSAYTSLKLIAGFMTEEINKAVSEGNFLPRDELYYQTRIDGFEYGVNGVKVGRISSQYIRLYHDLNLTSICGFFTVNLMVIAPTYRGQF